MGISIKSYSSANYEVMVLVPFSEDHRGFDETNFSSDEANEVIKYLEENRIFKVNGSLVRGWISSNYTVQVLDRKNNRIIEGDAWEVVTYLNEHYAEVV